MTVAELIENLKDLPSEMEVTFHNAEWGIEERLSRVGVETEWNGALHLTLGFDGEYEVEPTPEEKAEEPKPCLWRCRYCGKEQFVVYAGHCNCQNWLPAMVRAEPQEEPNAPDEDDSGRDQDDADPRPSSASPDAG